MRRRTEDPIRISEIARATGVSARTLVRAFQAIHGATPYRYLSWLRLLDARQALSSGTEEPQTVTEVALRFGFGELGRFSAAYRSAFGESPSATLRRSSQPGQEPAPSATACGVATPLSPGTAPQVAKKQRDCV